MKIFLKRGTTSFVVLLFIVYSAAAYACCEEDPSSDIDWLKLLGLIGAAIAFLAGLQQYGKTQRWKRVEFLANEIKELLADRRASLALSMIDRTSTEYRLNSRSEERRVGK